MNPSALKARVKQGRDNVGLPGNKFKCTVHVCFKGAEMFAEERQNDLFAVIDLTTEKVQHQFLNRGFFLELLLWL